MREKALDILVSYASKNDNGSTLSQLLADIHGSVVEDLEDELLGTLLAALYPVHIFPTEVWQYFRQPKSDSLLGAFWHFWHDLPKKNVQENGPVLLDALFSTGYQLSNRHDHLSSSRIVGELLVCGVMQHGADIDVQRLYGWLSLGLGPQSYCPLEMQHKTALGRWLSEHPAIYKVLFEHGLHLQASSGDTASAILWRIRAHLYGAQEPDNAEFWYFSLAEACSNNDLRRRLVEKSLGSFTQKENPTAVIELLEQWSSNHPNDAAWAATQLQCPYPPSQPEQEHIDCSRIFFLGE